MGASQFATLVHRAGRCGLPARPQRASAGRARAATGIGRIACGLVLAFLPALVTAASITLHPNGHLLVLEGRIDVGDFAKVEQLARQAAPSGIYLASPGGNLGEAMRIGTLVRTLAWETKAAEGSDVPQALRAGVAASYGVRDTARNNQCASACFFIFVSGIHRDGHVLGIHEPYMSPTELERLQPDEASRRISSVKTVVELFLRKMNVPQKFFEEMYQVPKDQMRWLTPEEIAADFQGFIPSVRDWVRGECGDDYGTSRCKDRVMMGIRMRALQDSGR